MTIVYGSRHLTLKILMSNGYTMYMIEARHGAFHTELAEAMYGDWSAWSSLSVPGVAVDNGV